VKPFKYQNYINQLSEPCPPSNYQPKAMTAYRFVFEETSSKSKNNFLPILMIQPKRQLNFNDTQKCQGYALSLFDTQENAEKRYLKLKKQIKNISKTLGTHLAEGQITQQDGVVSKTDNNGHFSLHEFNNTDLSSKFSIISSL
jgi:hypothetical protein